MRRTRQSSVAASEETPGSRGPADGEPHTVSGPVFLVALVVGWGVMLIGFRSALHELPNPADLVRWVGSGLIVHDGIWLPVTVAVGFLTARFLPDWSRTPVRLGLALSTVLVVVTLPVTQRWGALADNRSVDPGNAGLALIIILCVLWVALGAWAATQRRASRRALP